MVLTSAYKQLWMTDTPLPQHKPCVTGIRALITHWELYVEASWVTKAVSHCLCSDCVGVVWGVKVALVPRTPLYIWRVRDRDKNWDIEKLYGLCPMKYASLDKNKRRNQSDCQHEIQYVGTVPANPQLNPECDWECERRKRKRRRRCGRARKSLVRNEVCVCVCGCGCVHVTSSLCTKTCEGDSLLENRKQRRLGRCDCICVCLRMPVSVCVCVRVLDEWAV